MNIFELADLIVKANKEGRLKSCRMKFQTEVIENYIPIFSCYEKIKTRIVDNSKLGPEYKSLVISAGDKSAELTLKKYLYNMHKTELRGITEYQISSKETTYTGKSYSTLLLYIENENIKSTI